MILDKSQAVLRQLLRILKCINKINTIIIVLNSNFLNHISLQPKVKAFACSSTAWCTALFLNIQCENCWMWWLIASNYHGQYILISEPGQPFRYQFVLYRPETSGKWSKHSIGLAGATRLTRSDFRLNLLLLKGQGCVSYFLLGFQFAKI